MMERWRYASGALLMLFGLAVLNAVALYQWRRSIEPEPRRPVYVVRHMDARPWLEQKRYWAAVNSTRAKIAKGWRKDSASLVRFQRYMDSAYNPTYLLLTRADTLPVQYYP